MRAAAGDLQERGAAVATAAAYANLTHRRDDLQTFTDPLGAILLL
jgi:hypothetical protein